MNNTTSPTPKPFSAPNYARNAERADDADHEACALCGRPVLDTDGAVLATVVDGGARFVLVGETPDESAPGFMGSFLVGRSCQTRLRAGGVLLIEGT
jgi:hypothetical protein